MALTKVKGVKPNAYYDPSGGGGTLDHAALTSNLAWSTSAHTGTASRLAGFDGAGAAGYYTGSTALDLVANTRGMIPVRGAATWSGLTVGAATYLLGSDGTDPAWRSPANAKADLSLGNVENTALSTWAGSANITTLGTIATGVWSGTAVAVAKGGTGSTTASDARTALGLAIGTNVQAYDADLTGLAGLGNGLPVRDTTWGLASLTGLSLTGSTLAVLYGTAANTACQGNDTRLSAAGAALVALCGTGQHGNVTFNGTDAVTGFSLASRVYTATSYGVWEWATVTIDTTGGDVTIATSGCKLMGRALTITGSGTVRIAHAGSNGSGATGGSGALSATNSVYGTSPNGAAGKTNSDTAGNVGGSLGNGMQLGMAGRIGGVAKGAAAIERAGGAAGTIAKAYTATGPTIYGSSAYLMANDCGRTLSTSTVSTFVLYGGAVSGGGAGGGGTGNSGGGGGSGGLVGCFFASIATGTATLIIDASGGDGANATATTNAAYAGGSGGNGGGILFVCPVITGSNAIQLLAQGGDGGAAAVQGTGIYANGGPGGQGGLIIGIYSSAVTTPTASGAGGANGADAGVGAPAVGASTTVTPVLTQV